MNLQQIQASIANRIRLDEMRLETEEMRRACDILQLKIDQEDRDIASSLEPGAYCLTVNGEAYVMTIGDNPSLVAFYEAKNLCSDSNS